MISGLFDDTKQNCVLVSFVPSSQKTTTIEMPIQSTCIGQSVRYVLVVRLRLYAMVADQRCWLQERGVCLSSVSFSIGSSMILARARSPTQLRSWAHSFDSIFGYIVDHIHTCAIPRKRISALCGGSDTALQH